MSGEFATTPLPAETPAEAAARWFALRRRKPDCIEEQQFAEWLEADSEHRQAYDEVTQSWEIAGLASADPSVVAMRTEALMLRPPVQRDYSRLWGAAATLALILATSIGIMVAQPDFIGSAGDAAMGRDHLVLRTGVGERATAMLEDGSTVVLNTNSILEVNYSRGRRDVRLAAGQALFKVAHDASRPFAVAAADRQVIAIGTEFEVRLDGEKVRVALLRGRIRVEPIAGRAAPDNTAMLTPGEQLIASPAGILLKRADVEELVSWQSGRVRFDDTPLTEAAAEMNRYSRTHIVIDDAAAGRIRITGAFRAGQSRSFAETVSEAFPVKAEQSGETIRIHSRG